MIKTLKNKSKSKKKDKLTKAKSSLKKKQKIKLPKYIVAIKVLIIVALVLSFYHVKQSSSNTISLLAVSEDQFGEVTSGSVIKLHLTTKPGSGKINVNLNTIQEIDTQISIINSQKIACELFSLDCESYDFFYDFEGSALVLKGPSASSAIAVLVAKTLNKEKLDNNTVITGSLNSGGIIGNVGGVEEKVRTAEKLGFDKVLIPVFSEYNLTNKREIEVVKVIDIIEAYNNFNGEQFQLETKELDKTNYKAEMKELSEAMCDRSLELESKINFDLIKENSTRSTIKERAQNSFNLSLETTRNENYYSSGSFCYNTNLNYRILLEEQNNLTLEDRDEKLVELKKELDLKYIMLNSESYKNKIKTINDFYVYLLITDRLEEAKDFVKEAIETTVYFPAIVDINETVVGNETNKTPEVAERINYNATKRQKELLYSYAVERYKTVELWEELILNTGTRIKFNDEQIAEVCTKINREIIIKSELLKNYGFTFFNEEINKQNSLGNSYSNHYLCIYKGLELDGKINSVLNSIGIEEKNQKEYGEKILDLTQSRLATKDSENFPIIPYIYFEYSRDLLEQDDLSSSMLYSNYALSYADLNLYLEKDKKTKPIFNSLVNELLSMDTKSLLFITSTFVLLAFLGYS